MKRARMVLLAVVGLAMVLGVIVVLSAASAGDAAFLPGITGKDENPNGCVDCHKSETALPVVLAKVKGHPKVEKIVKTVPKDCKLCHKAGGKAAEMNLAMHKAHYQKPAENGFVTSSKGACLHCHSLDMSTGAMGVKSGPKNW